MRKIFTILAIVLGFYSLASAQEQKGNIEFGVNIGLNNSYVQESGTSQHTNGVTGFNVGISADSYFSDRWSLKVKLIYDQKGWANGYLTDVNGNEIDNVDYKLNYITIPIMANWHFGHTRNWYLDFGPYIGILTSAKAAGYDVKSAFNTVDGGLAFGIGIKILISDRAKFFIEAEGQGGVSDVFSNNNNGPSLQNSCSSLNIGVNF